MALAIHSYISGQPHGSNTSKPSMSMSGGSRACCIGTARDSRLVCLGREVVRMNQDLMVVIAREGGRSSNHAQGLLGARRRGAMTPWNGMYRWKNNHRNDFGHQAFDAKK